MAEGPATTSKAYDAMLPDWELARALMGGTRAMRDGGVKWLPKEPSEMVDSDGEIAYANRLDRTTLFNAYERSVDAMTGAVFRDPLTIVKEAPESLQEWSQDIDLAGRDLNAFAADVFADGLAMGLSHILIDAPANGTARTRADERASGRRPYWVHVKAENVIAWKTEKVDGRTRLAEVRIKESETKPDGEWDEKVYERVRVLRPGSFQIFEKTSSTTKSDEWRMVEEGRTSSDEITLVTFYAKRTGFMKAKPPMMDMAWLNLAHWQSSSDQRNILHIARVPILAFLGFDEEDLKRIYIGATHAVRSSKPESKIEFIEHSGAAIEAGRQDLIDVEDRMAAMGLELLVRRTGDQTATAKAIDTAKAESALATIVRSFANTMDQAFEVTARLGGVEATGGNIVSIDPSSLPALNDGDIDRLLEMRTNGDLSRETFWAEAVRRSLLDESFDPEMEAERLAVERRSSVLGRTPLRTAT